ncbi:hypothetical protein [Glycomyces sp. NPDC048151]|uniref:hypothetical protein n=1 Tax=Glycomyces sp. NPDC048151 TaxID=3364002 RepID=UPI003717F860
MPTPLGRLPFLLLALAAAAAAAACTGEKDDDPGAVDDEAGLLAVVNENLRLEAELADAERRLVVDCLEAQGFAVHDEMELALRWQVAEQDALVETYPFEGFLHEPGYAAEWGFGQWAYSDEGYESGADEEHNEAFAADSPITTVDNAAFYELSYDDIRAWRAAYAGEEYASMGDGLTAGDATADASDDGEIAIAPELQEAARPGGCLLDMIESLYGAPEAVAANGATAGTVWSWGPRSPQEAADWDALREAYRAAVVEPETAFLDCVEAGGWGDWEFDRTGSLPVNAYFNKIYYPGQDFIVYDDDGLLVDPQAAPEPPDDLGTDFEAQKAHEIAMAVAFDDCAETTGYREDAEAAYRQVQLDLFLTMDEELYAYQDDLRTAVEAAQEAIGG